MSVDCAIEGEGARFEENWQSRPEALYTHWTRGVPANQIQLAFRNHWTLFNRIMESGRFNGGKRVLEVGCGRGSLSCYFSDAGYECTLVDVSETAIQIARSIFAANELKGRFVVADATDLPFEDGSFDLVFSIGLLEHFQNVEKPIQEQVRILDKGGLFLGYVVPTYENNVQAGHRWITEILAAYATSGKGMVNNAKEAVFRSDSGSADYIPILRGCGLTDIQTSGVYPLPMISHATDFPFTLMPETAESILVDHFQKILDGNGRKTGMHPWLCEEGFGQAFLVWGFKQ